MKSCPLRIIKYLAFIIVVTVIASLFFIYSGVYPMGADTPHNKFTYWVLETLRDRSITRAASNVKLPENLSSPARLLRGGPDYNEMCVSCHLSPSKSETDFTKGLYPSPPNLIEIPDQKLNEAQRDQRRFWIIKHGIKASGMPSWAYGHDDERIWDMVAFLKKLPTLSLVQYQILTSKDDENSRHDH
ncbi:MAG: cytochrome c [Gammaproteobacteria bacterium]|nr:cytochrome c [Gammaproteobacteria bacterium]